MGVTWRARHSHQLTTPALSTLLITLQASFRLVRRCEYRCELPLHKTHFLAFRTQHPMPITSREYYKLLFPKHLRGELWIRRVLVRAQEGNSSAGFGPRFRFPSVSVPQLAALACVVEPRPIPSRRRGKGQLTRSLLNRPRSFLGLPRPRHPERMARGIPQLNAGEARAFVSPPVSVACCASLAARPRPGGATESAASA